MAGYRALYRETRPEIFSEIIGQDHIVKILRHQVQNKQVGHAYLFCGTRGTGKTTTARILAKAVNCIGEGSELPCGECENCRAIAEGTFLDVIEIDAASNNGVDNIRDLRDSVWYPPAKGRRKVYIIDEVHMLSTGAFNALLKTLEEPPENVMFILATTNPEKLPQTVLSRCLRLDFRRVSADILSENMRKICNEKDIKINDAALKLLASNADGSVRDSLSMLEQCLSSGEKYVTRDTVLEFLGTVSEEFFVEFTDKVIMRNISSAFMLLDRVIEEGKDVKQIMKDWMGHFRNLMITKYVSRPEDMLNLSEDNIELLRKQSDRIELDEINHAIITLANGIRDARYSTQARILMEVCVVTIASGMEYGKKVQRKSSQKFVDRGIVSIENSNAESVKNKVSDSVPAGGVVLDEGEPVDLIRTESVSVVSTEEDRSVKAEEKDATMSQDELDEIWRTVYEEAASIEPSLSVLNSVTLTDINETQFKVIVSSEFMQMRLEKSREMLVGLMNKLTGKNLSMVCCVDMPGRRDERNVEDIAKQASELFGCNVEIRD